MNAAEVMMNCPFTLDPNTSIEQALQGAAQTPHDVIPLVDSKGRYVGTLPVASLVDAADKHRTVRDLCCDDAIVCAPDFALEELNHDASSATPHRTIVVVDDQDRFCGIVPYVHWAVDEAKVQSGHPRHPLEVRTYSMHLIWRCLNCGELLRRNTGTPTSCPGCGGKEFGLHTED